MIDNYFVMLMRILLDHPGKSFEGGKIIIIIKTRFHQYCSD